MANKEDAFRFNYARDQYFAGEAAELPARAEELTAYFERALASCENNEEQDMFVKLYAEAFLRTAASIKAHNHPVRARALCDASEELFNGLKPHRSFIEQKAFFTFLARESNTLIEVAEHQTTREGYETLRDMAITFSDMAEEVRNPAPAPQQTDAQPRPAYKKPQRFTL